MNEFITWSVVVRGFHLALGNGDICDIWIEFIIFRSGTYSFIVSLNFTILLAASFSGTGFIVVLRRYNVQ